MSEASVGFPGNSEDMERFFDTRAADYERHMRENLEGFDAFYRGIADVLPERADSPNILDLGIGTGLELDHLFDRFPGASVTGIDLSEGMLDELARKNRPWSSRVRLITGSFLKLDLGWSRYDAVISSMTLHHWIPQVKLDLYRKIRRALRIGGLFVNGDYIESESESHDRLADFAKREIDERHHLHIDLPLSVGQELELLSDAGFDGIHLALRQAKTCVFVAVNPSGL